MTVRRHGLVPQSAGIEAEASSRALVLRSRTSSAFNTTTVIFGADGAVMVESDVSSEGTMGGMALSYPRVQRLVAAVTGATQDLWALVPSALDDHELAELLGLVDLLVHDPSPNGGADACKGQ